MAFKTLYCIFGKVLVIIDVINVKHYVDNINRRHNVAMATYREYTVHVLYLCSLVLVLQRKIDLAVSNPKRLKIVNKSTKAFLL